MAGEGPGIEELVGFLHQFAPRRLEALKAEAGPADLELLKPGVVLGARGGASAADLRLKAAHTTTEEIRKAIQAALPAAVAKLKSARLLNFWSGITTALGSSSAIGTAIQGAKWATIISAGIALVGVIASEGRRLYLAALGDGQRMGGAEAAYTTLLESSVEADQLTTELDIAMQTQVDDSAGLVVKASELAKRARMAIEALR